MLSSNIYRFLDEPINSSSILFQIPHNGRKRKHDQWMTSISIKGFEPSEVAIIEEENDSGAKIIIHAKHDVEGDYSELKKSIKIPSNIDHKQLQTIMSKDGMLILKAPCKNTLGSCVQPLKINRTDSWNGIWSELGRLNEQINQLIESYSSISRPQTEIICNDGENGGKWKLILHIDRDFKTDEIKLRNINNQIHLEARKENRDNSSCISRYINEIVSIPNGVETDKLKSKLLENGKLIVEAPFKKILCLAKGDEGNNIPIESIKSLENNVCP